MLLKSSIIKYINGKSYIEEMNFYNITISAKF